MSSRRLLVEELIPLYEVATISSEDEDLLEEMLPLRADAEQLASDLHQDAADLADGTRAEVEELIARNASSFASSRPCSSASRRARSSSRCCWGSSSRGR